MLKVKISGEGKVLKVNVEVLKSKGEALTIDKAALKGNKIT